MKKFVLVLLTVLVALPLAAEPGNCPGKGDFGVTAAFTGYTSEAYLGMNPFCSFGIAYHFSDIFFIRPKLIFNYISDDRTSDPTANFFILGVTINSYFSVVRNEGLSVYLGPELTWFTSNTGDNTGYGDEVMKIAANIGVQYNFSRHFAIHAELGAGIIRKSNYDSSGDTHDINIGISGAFAGLTFYL